MPSILVVVLITLSITRLHAYQELSIEISCVPPYGAGSNSWGTISGNCNCADIVSNISETPCSVDWADHYSVVIWSITNTHYIQPWRNDYYTTIDSSGLWSAGIHLGYVYEVDLVAFEDKENIIDTDNKDGCHDDECTDCNIVRNNSFYYSALLSVLATLLFCIVM
eukprot:131849_1